jgi:hypothetical protein
VLSIVTLTAFVMGCGRATQLGPQATREPAPAKVEAMLLWLEDRTLRCLGPDAGHLGATWTCSQDQAEGIENPVERTVYRVEVVAVGPELAVIDATVDQSADDAVEVNQAWGFLGDTIGLSPPTADVGPALEAWVIDTLDTGGQATFGPISARLTPLGQVTRLRLEFELLPGSGSG